MNSETYRQRSIGPKKSNSWSAWERWFAFFVLSCVVGSWLGFAGKWCWLFDLAAHFRVQYAWVLGLGGLWAFRRRHVPMAILALATCAMNVAWIAPIYQAPLNQTPRNLTGRGTDVRPAHRFRLLCSNVLRVNENHNAVLRFVRQESPDIAVFLEVSESWYESLQSLQSDYPYVVAQTDAGNFGIAVFSRIPFEHEEIILGPVLKLPSVRIRFSLAGHPATLIATHPIPPKTSRLTRIRNQHLDEIADIVVAESNPVLLVGDLNITSWSPWFADLLQRTGLRDSRHGYGVQASWPAQIPFLRIPIDHCLVSAEVDVVDRRLGDRVGSDHLPLICDLRWFD